MKWLHSSVYEDPFSGILSTSGYLTDLLKRITVTLHMSLCCVLQGTLIHRRIHSAEFPFGGNINISYMYALVLLCINQQTKFEVPIFTNSKVQPFQRYGWCPPKFIWFTLLDHAHLSLVCHTCYYQLAYHTFWSLYVRPLRRYEKGSKMWKMG